MLIAGLRFGVDYDAVDYTDMTGLIDVPLLTFQTSEDQTMPTGCERPVHDCGIREGREVRGRPGRGPRAVVERRPAGL